MLVHETAPIQDRKGQLAIVVIPMIILVAFFFSIYAADMQHLMAAQAQLQNATDAAALAGAQDLWFDLKDAESDALAIAGRNMVDGKQFSTSTPGTTIDIVVTAPKGTTPGNVMCTGSVRVKHLFAPLLGRFWDTVTATSIAGTSGSLYLLEQGQAFPLAVSLDMVPELKSGAKGTALNACNLGDNFTIYIGSQSVKNGAFTGFSGTANASYINDAIDQSLGLATPIDNFIPSVKVGDSISLTNGLDGQKKLGHSEYLTPLQSKVLILPVVMGDPAMNKPRQVVAFIGFQVQSIVTDSEKGMTESITGKLVKPQVTGVSGPIPLTGNSVNDSAISKLNLGPIQLIR